MFNNVLTIPRSVKGGYKEIEGDVACAQGEPAIVTPDIQGPFAVDGSYRFLVLLSAGVFRTWEAATSSSTVNADVVGMIASECAQQETNALVAQAVVDRIARLHSQAYEK